MTAQDLKNSILQLAVQGKLVPQDPNDEPASELLKRIRIEKTRLIADGKIKRSKTSKSIEDNEILFDLPNGWAWCRISDLLYDNLGGGTPAKNNPQYWGNEISWASVKDLPMDDIWLNATQDSITIDGLNNSSSNLIPANNVIICTRMGLGKVVINKIDVAINQDLRALLFTPWVNKLYILYFFKTVRLVGKGQTVKGITVDVLENLLFPLPPLKEQERIVKRIEEILPYIDNYREVTKQLSLLNASFPDKLRKSILQQAVQGKLTERDPADEPASELLKRIRTEKAKLIAEEKIKKEKPLPPITDDEKPFDIPDTWEWVRLGELGETQTGTTPSTKNPAFFGNDIPFIKPADIYADHINYENEGLSFAGSEQGRIISKNSIMMVCIGGSIGKTYYNDRSVCCNQQINTITPIFCSVKYVWLAMSSNYFRCELQKEATGTATPIINKSLWSNIVIPLPPLAEQERIVARVEELLAVCDGLK